MKALYIIVLIFIVETSYCQNQNGVYSFITNDSTFYYLRFYDEGEVKIVKLREFLGYDMAFYWLRRDSVDVQRGLCGHYGNWYNYTVIGGGRRINIRFEKGIHIRFRKGSDEVFLDDKKYHLNFHLNKGTSICEQ